MKNNRVSERYSKSLFQLSIKDNLLNDVKSDIDYLKKLFSSSREISQLYINPIIPITIAAINCGSKSIKMLLAFENHQKSLFQMGRDRGLNYHSDHLRVNHGAGQYALQIW